MQVVTPTFHTGNSAISSEGVGQLLQPWLPSMGQCCEEHLLSLYLYEIQPLIHILGNFNFHTLWIFKIKESKSCLDTTG